MYQLFLSPYQKNFYDNWKADPDKGKYNIIIDQELLGRISTIKLDKAIKRFISEQILLNSHIEKKEEKLYWIKNSCIYGLDYFRNKLTNKELLSYVQKPFSMDNGPLYRFGLIKSESTKYRLIIVIHQVIFNSLSTDSLFSELSNYYNEVGYARNIDIEKQISKLAESSTKLSKYIDINTEKSLLFWKEKLSDIEPLDLRFLKLDKQRSKLLKYEVFRIGEESFSFNNTILSKLNILKSKHAITPYLYSKSICAALLSRCTGQKKFCISYPVELGKKEDSIYETKVNILAVPYDFTQINNIIDIINQTSQFIQSLKHNNIDYSYLTISHIISSKDILTFFFNDVNRENEVLDLKNIKSGICNIINANTLNDVLFEQRVNTKEINYKVKYKLTDIDPILLNEFTSCYKQLFIEILDELISLEDLSKLKHIKDYNILSQEQYQQIIHDWNKTDIEYSRDKTIQIIFEEQVERSPKAVAVIYEDIRLTYRELNQRANQLANYIREIKDIHSDTLIALCLDRSEHMLIAILAVLKAGGAYVPIDPSYPDDRIKYLLEDTSTGLILTNKIHKQRLEYISKSRLTTFEDNRESKTANSVVNVLRIEDTKKIGEAETCILDIDSQELEEKLVLQSIANPETETSGNNLAYVIYTSGTTGNPKGVLIEHRGVINFCCGNNYITVNGDTIALSYSNYVFDGSIFDIFTLLLNGGRLIIVRRDVVTDAVELKKTLIQHSVNTMFITTALFVHYSRLKENNPLNCITNLLFGGEKLNTDALDDFLSNNSTNLVHVYGPTENIVFSTYCYINSDNKSVAPIGKKLLDKMLYVLDNNLNTLPIGCIGELYVGGDGLARGYLNRPDLTAERFIANPFQTEEEKHDKSYGDTGKNARLYKTGDLVRWLPDGNLEYIERNDFQIKIRGYRIELGEIENILSGYIGVRQNVVLVREHIKNIEVNTTGNKYLVGYYVADTKLDEQDILKYLQNKLPEYMVPSILVYLEELPITINGKLDRKALPNPEFTNSDSYKAPRNEWQKKLCQIWADVLGVEASIIGVENNFFDLGGNSLLIAKLKIKIEQSLNIRNISVTDLFKYPTIKALNDFLLENNKDYKNTYRINDLNNLDNFGKEIAVISMSGIFSGSSNIEEYWNNIINGIESLDSISRDDCIRLKIPQHILNNKNYVPVGGVIKDIDKFDPSFWKLSVNDAILLDPQIRKFLEHSWIALEKSGYIRVRDSKNIGVFAGIGTNNYYINRVHNNKTASPTDWETGSIWKTEIMDSKNFLATKVSYLLGLNGVALNISTACSTSLVAIVEACKNLAIGSCDMALAGGVFFPMPEDHGHIYQEGMILSKDGHCKVFDKDSSGTVTGSGLGVVVLKRLEEAVRDKDQIIAVIKGYATNNDGNRKVGYTAPSVIGQAECIIAAQDVSKITADTIDYVECHGTGTALGDPIEIAALHDAFKNNSQGKKGYNCILGSVKANIGHAVMASGVAGFIKICKMLQDKVIPPQIHFNTPNENLNLEQTNFRIVKKQQYWSSNNKIRRAGVSSFGIGGTNAHIILEEYNLQEKGENILKQSYYILPISAKTKSSYKQYCNTLADYLVSFKGKLYLSDLAYTLQCRREHFDYRNIVVCKDKEDIINQLREVCHQSNLKQSDIDIIFMFSGQGAQYSNMGKDLYDNELVFRSYIDKCCDIIYNITKVDFKKYLYPDTNQSNDFLQQTKWAQPALFIVCYSLSKLLESFEIYASTYIGHSIGEYIAATLSGIFSLEDAIKVVLKRGELMQQMLQGSMLSINSSMNKINEILPDYLDISVYNAPEYLVVSGEDTKIELFKKTLDDLNISSRKLHTLHAFHSRMMYKAAEEFEQYLKHIKLNRPNKDFISNVTGDFIDKVEATSIAYWADHIRKPVKFSQGIEKLNQQYKNPIYIEVGPGKVLSTFIAQHPNKEDVLKRNYIDTIPDAKAFYKTQINGSYLLHNIFGKLWSFGYNVNWSKIQETNDTSKVIDLPTYQFEKKKCWVNLPKTDQIEDLQIKSISEWLYQLTWIRISRVTNLISIELTESNCWLVFNDKLGKLNPLINLLRKNNQRVIVVDYDISNEDILIHSDKVIINLYDETHYTKLANYLITNNINISYIIHGWLITEKEVDLENDYYQHLGFYSLFLLQTNFFSKTIDTIKFVLITNGLNQVNGQDKIHPNKGTILGAIRAIPHENPQIKACTLDIGFDELILSEQLLYLLITTNNYKLEPNLSIRAGYLWKEEITPIDVNNIPSSTSIINNNDIILITGGLGGVGLVIAKEISTYHQVTFILVNRTGISTINNEKYKKFQLESLNFIKKNNCEFELYTCDISETIELTKLINFIKTKYNRLDGVIHAAGNLPLTITERNLVNIKHALKSKVLGTENLFKMLKSDSLKFFVMTSSLASIMGDIGRLEYCAANSYLDVLSGLETNNIDRMISINWPDWYNVGASVKLHDNTTDLLNTLAPENNYLLNILDQNSITEDEGAKIFYKLINQTVYKQIAISKFDILVLKQKIFENASDFDVKSNDIEQKNILIDENITEIENKIAKIFYLILGVKEFSKHDNYFELGGNSLLAIKLISEAHKMFNISISLPMIFEHNTINKLAKYLEHNLDSNFNKTSMVIEEGEL